MMVRQNWDSKRFNTMTIYVVITKQTSYVSLKPYQKKPHWGQFWRATSICLEKIDLIRFAQKNYLMTWLILERIYPSLQKKANKVITINAM